jgi:uncharacterized protein YrzB (UPF0473 family)
MVHEHNHNHEEEEQYITLINENGDEELFEILFTFDSEEFEKSYVLCYPVGDVEDEEEVIVHAYAYTPTEDGSIGELMPVTTDEEWDIIEEVYNTFTLDEDEE